MRPRSSESEIDPCTHNNIEGGASYKFYISVKFILSRVVRIQHCSHMALARRDVLYLLCCTRWTKYKGRNTLCDPPSNHQSCSLNCRAVRWPMRKGRSTLCDPPSQSFLHTGFRSPPAKGRDRATPPVTKFSGSSCLSSEVHAQYRVNSVAILCVQHLLL